MQKVDDMILVTGIPPEKLAALALKVKLNLYHLEVKHSSLEELFMTTTRDQETQVRIPQTNSQPASKVQKQTVQQSGKTQQPVQVDSAPKPPSQRWVV